MICTRCRRDWNVAPPDRSEQAFGATEWICQHCCEASAAAAPDVSEAELSEWEALCDACVVGPWKVQRYSNYEGWAVFNDTFGCVAERWEADATKDAQPERAKYFDAHSKLVATSRTALPRLIAALRAARKRDGEAVAENERLRKALRIFRGCAYPVSTEINPRGHDWRGEESLDYALSECEAALNEGAKNG